MSATGAGSPPPEGLAEGLAGGGTADDKVRMDSRLQAHIGRQLKSMYDEYLSEPVPDHLLELLERLDTIPHPGEPQRDPTDGEPA